MMLLLGLSYVVHVLAALVWIGAVVQVTYTLLARDASAMSAAGVTLTLDRVLRVTRWTGLALPITGLYQVWALYPLDRLLGTTRGSLVLGMFLLWGVMNTIVEAGVYRARTVDGSALSMGVYMTEGARADGGLPTGRAAESIRAARPYLLAATLLGVLLAVDAGLLAGGLAYLQS